MTRAASMETNLDATQENAASHLPNWLFRQLGRVASGFHTDSVQSANGRVPVQLIAAG